MTLPVTLSDTTRGVLHPAEGLKRIELRRGVTAPDLAGLVDWHWIVGWSLVQRFEQVVLPHPCVNLVIDARGSAVHGIGMRRMVTRLEGTGRVVATKFKPGRSFLFARRMRDLVDCAVPLVDAFGAAAEALDHAVQGHPDDDAAIDPVEGFLRAARAGEDAALGETMAL
jgi:hypothetical protein